MGIQIKNYDLLDNNGTGILLLLFARISYKSYLVMGPKQNILKINENINKDGRLIRTFGVDCELVNYRGEKIF